MKQQKNTFLLLCSLFGFAYTMEHNVNTFPVGYIKCGKDAYLPYEFLNDVLNENITYNPYTKKASLNHFKLKDTVKRPSIFKQGESNIPFVNGVRYIVVNNVHDLNEELNSRLLIKE